MYIYICIYIYIYQYIYIYIYIYIKNRVSSPKGLHRIIIRYVGPDSVRNRPKFLKDISGQPLTKVNCCQNIVMLLNFKHVQRSS